MLDDRTASTESAHCADREALPMLSVTIPALDARFSCARGQHVLHAMLQSGLRSLAVGCRSGGCGVCRVRVIAGSYATAPMSRARITSADEDSGIVLACRIRPLTDLVLEPLPLSRGLPNTMLERAA